MFTVSDLPDLGPLFWFAAFGFIVASLAVLGLAGFVIYAVVRLFV